MLRIKLACKDRAEFARIAPTFSSKGVFTTPKTLRPVGTHLRVKLQLSSGEVAVSGDAVVVRHYASGPKKGMVLYFTQLDPDSFQLELRPIPRILPSPQPGGRAGPPPVPPDALCAAALEKTPVRARLDSALFRGSALPAAEELRDIPASAIDEVTPTVDLDSQLGSGSELEVVPGLDMVSDSDIVSGSDVVPKPDVGPEPDADPGLNVAREVVPTIEVIPRLDARPAIVACPEADAAQLDVVPATRTLSAPKAPRARRWPLLIGAGAALCLVAAAGGARAHWGRGEDPVSAAIGRADERIASGRLVGPGGDEALDILVQARQARPGDPRVLQRLHALAAKFEQMGDDALERGNAADAAAHFQAAVSAEPQRASSTQKLKDVEGQVRAASRGLVRAAPDQERP